MAAPIEYNADLSNVDVEKGLNISSFRMRSEENEAPPSVEEIKERPPAELPMTRVFPWSLYRYAQCLDVFLILLGTVCAVAGGLAQPLHVLIFGEVVNQFVYYNVTRSLKSLGNSSGYFCKGTFVDTSLLKDYFNSTGEKLQTNIEIYSYYYIGVATGAMLAVYLANVVWNLSAYRQTRRMRSAFYSSVLRQEVGWFDEIKTTAQLNTLLQDNTEKIQSGIGDKSALFLQYMTTFVAGFVIAFVKSWKLSLVLASVAPVLVGAGIATSKVAASFTAKEQKAYASAGAVAEEVLSSIRTVVAFGGEEKEARRYDIELKKSRRAGLLKGLLVSLIEGITFFVIFGLYPLGFWYGSKLFISCEISAGEVVTVFFSIVYGSVSFGYSLSELQTFGAAIAAAKYVFGIIDRVSAIDPASEQGERPDTLTGKIEFSDVVFEYPARPGVQVLRGLDISVEAGQTVAIVGTTGCGKSTTVKLVQRYYDPIGGQVTIDGKNIKDLNLRWLREHIGVVSQEPVLFNTTIAENIRYGRLGATMEEIQQAARKANIFDDIMRMSKGFDTLVGELGGQLSGGQKQRIAIARALVRNPKILLLDEATSALDNESEKVVQEALDKAREGRTTIIIAHKLSTVRNADIIFFLREGRVAESGTHLALMSKEGPYYDMVTATVDETDALASDQDNFMADVTRSVRTYSVSRRLSSMSCITASLRRGGSFNGPPALPPKGSILELRESPYSSLRRNVSYFHKEEEVDVDYYNVNTEEHKEEERKSVPVVSFKELLKFNAPDWIFVLIGIIFSAANGTIFPLIAVPSSEILKVYGENSTESINSTVSVVCLKFLGLAVAAFLATFIGNICLSIAGERLTKRLRLKSFQCMLKQNMGWYDNNTTGILSTRLAVDASEVKGVTGIRFGVLSKLFSSIITALVIGLVATWQLALLMMVCFATVALTSFLQLKLIQGRSNKNKELLEDSASTAVETFSNARTVIGLGVGERFSQMYSNKLDRPFRENMANVISLSVVLGLAQGMIYYLFAAGIRLGSFLVAENDIEYDSVFRVFQAVVFTALAIGRALSSAPDTAKARVSASRIHALLQLMPTYLETGRNMEKSDGAITLTNVTFSYPTRPEATVLCGLNISATPGKALALVGTSGCGKSTVVSLIERFYDPSGGSISLDGKDIQELNISWLRRQIGLVSQEPVLFDVSVADNIRYGDNSRVVPMEEVIEAAKAANIHSLIESLPQGYETNAGARGAELSGGQKQRIAIARALVRNPKILLLDEATSALDNESEKVVQEALDNAREGRTTIIIAHRLSTIRNADHIAMIYKGKVLEQGTHAELMARKGAYYNFNRVEETEGQPAATDL